MSNSSNKTLLALLAGAAVGAGLGILFAPEKGSITRAKMKETVTDAKDNLASKMDEFSKAIKEKLQSGADVLESKVDLAISETAYKTEEAIEVLEKKLAQLKAEVKNSEK